MVYLASKQEAMDFLKALAASTDIIHNPTGYLAHSENTGDIAAEIVDSAVQHYPGLKSKLSQEEVSIAGYLHDSGRPLHSNQLFHEIRGAAHLEQSGLDNVTNDKVLLYRLAQMFRSHWMVADHFADPENAEEAKEFEDIDPLLLIPRTWQEGIIIYSDLTNNNGERVSIDEKMADIRERYSNDPKYNVDKHIMRSMERGLDNVLAICKRVERLKNGTLLEEEIAQYGFI